MVSILTSRTESTGSLGTRSTADALDVCHKNGIEVEPLADFYQRFVAFSYNFLFVNSSDCIYCINF